MQKSDWIFPSATRRNAHRTTVAKSFRCCVISAKLDPQKIKPYTLRRTSITDVADTKIDVAGLMEISGHKSVEMVLRYVHTRKERIRRSMRALEVH